MFDAIRAIADAVLLEGYVLYPYRASARKNRYRWTFGVVVPEACAAISGEAHQLHAQCLGRGRAPRIAGQLRFLQIESRSLRSADGFEPREQIELDGVPVVAFEEGQLREVDFALEPGEPLLAREFSFAAQRSERALIDRSGRCVGHELRRRERLCGRIELALERCFRSDPALFRLSLAIENNRACAPAADRAEALRAAFASTHVLLSITGGEFVSLRDPPAAARSAANSCMNRQLHPVLAGEPGRRDLLLLAPIIVDEHPQVAPESQLQFCDGGEIDELLMLRTLTLTDAEKAQARATDPRAGALIDGVEAADADVLARLHGAIRERSSAPEWKAGERVRLRPGPRRSDAQDFMLAERIATIEAVREDVDGNTLLAVTIDDDPAAELHRWYGRFHYFYPDEVQRLEGT